MIRRLRPVASRAVFGALCIGGMAGVALPVLFVAGIAAAFVHEGGKAIAVWLLSWAASVFSAVLFVVIAYVAWPRASDWVVDWQGYAIAIGIGTIGLGAMAALVFATPLPEYAAVFAALGGTFVAGFAVPGRLLGLKPPVEARAATRSR